MKRLIFSMLLLSNLLSAQETRLTIYNSNFGIVKETITADLKSGKQIFTLDNLNYRIVPNSVLLKFNGNLFEYSFIMPQGLLSLLQNSLGEQITLINKESNEKITGNLLSVNPDSSPKIVLKKNDNSVFLAQTLDDYDIELKSLPKNINLNSKVNFTIEPQSSGKQNLQFIYQIEQINWNAEHFLIINDIKNTASLSSNFNIINNSLKDFTNTRLKLILGDVPKVNTNIYEQAADGAIFRALNSAKSVDYNQKELPEIFVWELNDNFSLKNGEIKRLRYKDADNIKFRRKKFASLNLVYGYSGAIDVFNAIEFSNKVEDGLGFVIPQGKISIFSQDRENFEFIGEIPIANIPINDTGTLHLGKSFNIFGKVDVQDIQYEPNATITTYKFTFFNESENDETLSFEIIFGDDTQIINCSHKYKFTQKNALKIDSNLKKKKTDEIILKIKTLQQQR